MAQAAAPIVARNTVPFWLPVLIFAAVMVAIITFVVAAQHDHLAYLEQWRGILAGDDPWSKGNAYGPLHNLFAYPYAIWDRLPRLLFVAMALGVAWTLMARVATDGRVGLTAAVLLVAVGVIGNPLMVFTAYVYSQNDIVCAFLLLLAFVARDKGLPFLAGALVGLAAVEKFYPILFAGFLMLDRDRTLNLRVLAGAVLVFAAGMLAAYLVWGPSVLQPFQFGSGRDAKILSIFRFLQCHPELAGGPAAVQGLVDANSYLVIGVAGASFLLLHAIGAGWQAGCALGILAVFATYKVGHQQFYISWLVAYGWLAANWREPTFRRLGLALLPVVVFMALFPPVYARTLGMTGEWAFLRCYISLPFMAIVVVSLWLGCRAIWQPPRLALRFRW